MHVELELNRFEYEGSGVAGALVASRARRELQAPALPRGRSEARERTLRMTALAARTNATLPRLSHVVQRLEDRGLVARFACPDDARATNARLTPAGWDKVRDTAPGHVANVRAHVLDALTSEQVDHLSAIGDAILSRLDPDGKLTSHRHE